MKENRMYIKCDRCGKETSVGIEKSKIENGKTIETWEGLPDGRFVSRMRRAVP